MVVMSFKGCLWKSIWQVKNTSSYYLKAMSPPYVSLEFHLLLQPQKSLKSGAYIVV